MKPETGKRRKKSLLRAGIWGFAFGILMAMAAFPIGLLVSPVAANIMLFPAFVLGGLLDTPFGYLPPALRLILLASCGVFWAVCFVGISAIYYRGSRKR